jgi:hypothetical protein
MRENRNQEKSPGHNMMINFKYVERGTTSSLGFHNEASTKFVALESKAYIL